MIPEVSQGVPSAGGVVADTRGGEHNCHAPHRAHQQCHQCFPLPRECRAMYTCYHLEQRGILLHCPHQFISFQTRQMQAWLTDPRCQPLCRHTFGHARVAARRVHVTRQQRPSRPLVVQCTGGCQARPPSTPPDSRGATDHRPVQGGPSTQLLEIFRPPGDFPTTKFLFYVGPSQNESFGSAATLTFSASIFFPSLTHQSLSPYNLYPKGL